jgi:hypothetical protein
VIFPEAWRAFVSENHLVGVEVSIPEEDDLSGVGACVEILSEEAALHEARSLFPGRCVQADGFIPVGGCGTGTGDPYFINVHDGNDGPLYRIDHEAVGEDGYDRDAAVAVVLARYSDLLRYCDCAG